MALSYQIVTFAGNSTISLFHRGKAYIANSDHPSWDKIVEGAKADDESVVDLFDIGSTINREFKRLSGRYTVENGIIKLDGDPMDNAFTKHVLAVLKTGDEAAWLPLVKFGERILANPSEYSRGQLYEFLDHNEFAINEDGFIIAHKGVVVLEKRNEVKDGKTYRSGHYGETPVSVNDEEAVKGYVYQNIGDVVSMARSLVDDNSGTLCSTGLHVSTYSYAKSYGDVVLDVLVDPANVVSVPNERGFEKIRTCGYINLRVSEGPHTEPVVVTGKAPEPAEPEIVVEGNLDTPLKVGDKVRLVEGGHWFNPSDRHNDYKYISALPWAGFYVGEEGVIADYTLEGYNDEDDFVVADHLLFRSTDNEGRGTVWLHKSSFERVSEVQDSPLNKPVEEKSAAERAGLVEGQWVVLNNFAWYDLDGNSVYDREYFRTRDLYLGTPGVVAENQRGALSKHNVKVDFQGDWTVWVAPESLR